MELVDLNKMMMTKGRTVFLCSDKKDKWVHMGLSNDWIPLLNFRGVLFNHLQQLFCSYSEKQLHSLLWDLIEFGRDKGEQDLTSFIHWQYLMGDVLIVPCLFREFTVLQ